MLSQRVLGLPFQRSLLLSNMVLAHSKTCPTQTKRRVPRPIPIPKKPLCPGSKIPKLPSDGGGTTSSEGPIKLPDIKRAEHSAPVRFGFIPETWFVFFYPHTGVTGPYIFGIVLINYWLSKEIYILEHEYYLGLSVALMTYYATTRLGPEVAKSLDAGIDAIVAEMEKSRTVEKDYYLSVLKEAEAAQMRANGQKILMDAKKENIAMQLEAAYRERLMMMYKGTKARLEYQAKKHWILSKIHQKWMIEWILDAVRKSITPELEQQALNAAIKDLSLAAVARTQN